MNPVGALAVWIVLFVVVMAAVQFAFSYAAGIYPPVKDYKPYVDILLSLFFGWQIVKAFADIIALPVAKKQGETAAKAVSNLIKIIGIGALVAAIAGAVSGGPAAAALGGFIGLVIGFATQQVLGQAVAGTFLLLARPFKIGDKIVGAGQEGVVEDINAMFTVIRDAEGNKILVPNNKLVGDILKIKKS
ncbi:mechanosensitive ion channel domain-containing protein [Pyrobaculum sp.]|uniref:mechanosensitive ion channel domain-containing protein n=1 Tax=Pyrobaculum sp. TaxID=2004705 RepID=UPI003D0BF0A8